MKKLFNAEQEKYIIENFETMKYKDIARNIGNGITSTQITGWIHNKGLKKEHRSIFSADDKLYIAENYKHMKYKEIAQNLGFSEKQIRHFVNHYFDSKLRKFNKRYFQYINTPTKAYWLGYIYADGYISRNNKTRNNEFGMELQKRDIDVLIDLNTELGSVHTIKSKHFEGVIYKNKTYSICDSVILRVYSKDIVDDLISHNILFNKTYKKDFPKVNNYFLDFLRGYIDGDGCIYINKNQYLTVHITSFNRYVLDYISSKLKNDYDIISNVYMENPRKYRLYIFGFQGMKLLDLIYYNNNVQKLDRKYKKYLLLKQKGSPYQK